MFNNRLTVFIGIFVVFVFFNVSSVQATKYTTQAGQSKSSVPDNAEHQGVIANNPSRKDVVVSSIRKAAAQCFTKWENESCIMELGNFNTILVTFFANDLEAGGHQAQLGPLRQSCAASTASSKVSVPAYAQSSAMTECVNAMFDLSVQANTLPEQTMYQFMVMSVMCLNKDQEKCPAMEFGVNMFLEQN